MTLLPMLLGIGGSAIAGAFGKKSTTSSTSTTTPSFSPEQEQLQKALAGNLNDRLTNPASLDPLKTAAASQVNRNYDTLQTGLDRTLAARGFGASGKAVTGAKDLAISRAGDLGKLQSQFAALQIDQGNQAVRDAQQFAFASPGQTSTGTQTGTQGGGVGGAIGGASETASLLYALNHFMNGGGQRQSPYAGNMPGGSYEGAGPDLPSMFSGFGGGSGGDGYEDPGFG